VNRTSSVLIFFDHSSPFDFKGFLQHRVFRTTSPLQSPIEWCVAETLIRSVWIHVGKCGFDVPKCVPYDTYESCARLQISSLTAMHDALIGTGKFGSRLFFIAVPTMLFQSLSTLWRNLQEIIDCFAISPHNVHRVCSSTVLASCLCALSRRWLLMLLMNMISRIECERHRLSEDVSHHSETRFRPSTRSSSSRACNENQRILHGTFGISGLPREVCSICDMLIYLFFRGLRQWPSGC
jgi:hypothetical protein